MGNNTFDDCQMKTDEKLSNVVMMTDELRQVLKRYPRGYHSVTSKQMDQILNAYEYMMESPGGISGRMGVTRETLRLWGKKKLIHYFVRRDMFLTTLEAYIPFLTFMDAQLPNRERYEGPIERMKGELEYMEKRRREYYEQLFKAEAAKKASLKETEGE